MGKGLPEPAWDPAERPLLLPRGQGPLRWGFCLAWLHLSAFQTWCWSLCLYQENREERCSLQPLATYTCSFTCSLPAVILLVSLLFLILLFILIKPLSCVIRREWQRTQQPLNMKTSGKRQIFLWTSLVTGCLDWYYLFHYVCCQGSLRLAEEAHLGFFLKIQKGKHKILISIYWLIFFFFLLLYSIS